MHGVRDGRTLSSPPPSMLPDETTKTDNNAASAFHNPPTEQAYLPIGCSVSAKYRGAFCSAQVKAIEKQVKLKVTLLDSGDTITIPEEQIVHSVPLRIGNSVTVRLASSNRRQSNDSNSHHHYSRSGLAAFINPTNPDEKQATIKQVIDNSIYTVVFNDGDEKSLRRSSLCLQGIRLYQTQYGQQKILEEIPTTSTAAATTTPSSTSPPPPPSSASLPTSADTTSNNLNDISSIVAIKRHGNSDQQVFPALILKRKALADYMWVRSFADGREYIVHTRDDVQPYQDNPDIQTLCRSTAKQATQACEKFLKYNHIPAVWQKKKHKPSKSDKKDNQSDAENSSESDSTSSESDDDDDDSEIDEETTEEKDSFVAQLFAFMDDRGTPINNIPKVQNYDLDLHRLFKIVRLLGGYNKVTKNDQWGTVHAKMGLPDGLLSENSRSVEQAYKNYLFAYEDLSKKLGSMNAPSAYFGGRTSMGSDSRRSLIRVRQQQQEEEKSQKKITKSKQSPAPVKQKSRKSNESRPSTESKQTASSSTKKPAPKSSVTPSRKGPNKVKPSNVLSSSTSDSESQSSSETSDDESSRSSSPNYSKTKSKTPTSAVVKKSAAATPSAIPKRVNPPLSSSSSPSSTKSDMKKTSTSAKPISSANNDQKQSKLTITIPIAKPKSQSTNNSNTSQSIKKPNPISSNKDEKKKTLDTKSIPIKTEPKPIPTAVNKKPLSSSSKTPQLPKSSQQQKQSASESVKSTSATKPSSSSSIPSFKPKTTQPQTSTNTNKERSTVVKATSSASTIDSRQIKSTKTNPLATKNLPQERSTSATVKKVKPTAHEESTTKPVPSASTMKIPKISDLAKKTTPALEKIPKKPLPKETTGKIPRIQDSTTASKSNLEQLAKAQTSSLTRSLSSETIKKPIARDLSPLAVTPVSPSSPSPSPTSRPSITEETLPPSIQPVPLKNTQSLSYPYDTTPEVKIPEVPLIFQSLPIGSDEVENNPSVKRSHIDETPDSVHIPSSISETDEQFSPSKRARRSISSQESIETFSDQLSTMDIISAVRNTQLIYEDIAINDILLVTWGMHGTKQYPARCIEKNDEKKELFVHYPGWNSRHDEWIKLDRIIERKDSTNANTLFQQHARRATQTNTIRQQHLDSTNSSTSNEQPIQSQISTSLSILPDDDEHAKVLKSITLETNKIEESDMDDNSQGHSEIWNHVETISSTTEEDALSHSSSNRPNQLDLTKMPSMEESNNIQRRLSITNTENNVVVEHEVESTDENDQERASSRNEDHIQHTILKRRQSRATSINNKSDSATNIKSEQIEETSLATSDILEHPHQYPLHVKEETIDSSSISHPSFSSSFVPPSSTLFFDQIILSSNLLTSPPGTATGNRRASVRQQKRRSLREPNNGKDSSASAKKKPKLDNGNLINTEIGGDSMINSDQTSTRSNSTDQQLMENATGKRYRQAGRRGAKKSANQQEYENDDYRSNSPSTITMRQQLKDMFKHRASRYDFLDLNNTLTGDERITHLKDRMRECQKVFFNLKSALVKVEKQRKLYLRKQKPILTTSTILQTATSDILGTTTCT